MFSKRGASYPAGIIKKRKTEMKKSKSRSQYSFSSRVGKELSFVDTNINFTGVSTTSNLSLLNGVVPGTGASQRIGRKIQMKSYELKLYANVDTATTITSVRFMLVLDRQANAAAPVFADVYDQATTTTLRNISNKARFKVLYDSGLVSLTGNTAAPNDNSLVTFTHYRKCNIPVQYNAGTAGTIADIQTNSLYLMAIGSTVSGTADANLSGWIRVRYSDV